MCDAHRHKQISRPGGFHPEPLAEPCISLSIYTAPVIQPLPPETASVQTVAGTPSSSCATTPRYAVYAVVVSCTCTWPSARACGSDTDRAAAWPSDRKPRNSSTNHVSWDCIARPYPISLFGLVDVRKGRSPRDPDRFLKKSFGATLATCSFALSSRAQPLLPAQACPL